MAASNTITNAPPLLLAAAALACHEIKRQLRPPRMSWWISTTPHTLTLAVRIDTWVHTMNWARQMVEEPVEIETAAGTIAGAFIGTFERDHKRVSA